jgi:transposase
MKLRPLTTEMKARIIGMHEAGLSGAKIGRELGIVRQTISDVLKRFRLRGTVVSPKPPGRQPKLNFRDKRQLAWILVAYRRVPLAAIADSMRVKVCTRTVRKYIRSIGYSSRIAAKKPFLKDAHKVQRLAFARAHLHWTEDDWKNVIWTDESSFETGKHSRLIRVWRQAYERYSMDCLVPTFKSGRISVMVWGGFSGYDKSPIVIIPSDRRSAVDFVDIVYEGTLFGFYFLHDHPDNLFLMEDSAPVHRSRLPQLWKEAHHMKCLNWLPNSPDLNPIENLWRIIKDHVQNQTRPRNREEMAAAIEKAWEEVSRHTLDVLISTMPHRMRVVIHAKGGSTRW